MSNQMAVDTGLYWRAVADRRKIALQEANKGFQRLHRRIDQLLTKIAQQEQILGQQTYELEILYDSAEARTASSLEKHNKQQQFTGV